MFLRVLILAFFTLVQALIDREHFPYLAYITEKNEFVSMGTIVHSHWIVAGQKIRSADEARVGNSSFKEADRYGITLSYDHKSKFTLLKTNMTMVFNFYTRRINYNAFAVPKPEVIDGIGVSWLIPNDSKPPSYEYGFFSLKTLPAKECQRDLKPPYFCTAPYNNTVFSLGTPFIYKDHLVGVAHSAFLTQAGMVVNIFYDVSDDDIINRIIKRG